MVDQQRITEAVNYLIQAKNYDSLVREIEGLVARWDTHPMAYAGELSPLNSLLDVALSNPDQFGRLRKLIEDKRRLVPEDGRNQYQREKMRERRSRVYKALELQSLKGFPVKGAARTKWVKDLEARWRKERDQFIAAKGDLDWKGRNEAAAEFWSQIEANLDVSLDEAKAKKRTR